MSGLTYNRYKTWLALAVATLAVVSIAGPACESACGDSAPDNGSSCSGTARCGSTCGEFWECKDGTWSVGVADCFPIGDAREPDANVDADADAAQDAGAAQDADASDAFACPDGG